MSDHIAEAIQEAEAVPDFEYDAPLATRLAVLVDQAAGHVMAIERTRPFVQASKERGSPQQYEQAHRELQTQKGALGRCWLVCKSLGMEEREFRRLLDEKLLKAAAS